MSDLSRLKIERSPSRQSAPAARRGGPWFGRLLLLAALIGLAFVFQRQLQGLVDRFRLTEVRVEAASEQSALAASAVAGTMANGYIVAARRAALSADTPGRIVELLVTEGSVVRAGEVVARLYSEEFAAALRRAQAELDALESSLARSQSEHDARIVDVRSAEHLLSERETLALEADANIEDARAQLSLATSEEERARELLESGVWSQQRVDEATATLVGASARLTAAEAAAEAALAAIQTARVAVEQAQAAKELAAASLDELEAQRAVRAAARDQAQATLDKTEVRAPFDGVVVLKDAEVGEVVSPNSQGGSNARGSVATLVDFASLEVQVNVPEINLAKVEQDAKASIYLDAYPGRPYAGRVDRIWPTADRQRATVEVRVVFSEPDELLRPEMGARVVFEPKGGEGTPSGAVPEGGALQPGQITISIEALTRSNGKRGVFVLEGDQVSFRTLELGAERASRQLVISGLEAGERVVLDPPIDLSDGDRVRLIR